MYSGSVEEIIKKYKPYIMNLCSKTFVNGYTFEDLYQECCLCILKSSLLFDPNKMPKDSKYNEKSYFIGYALSAVRRCLGYKVRLTVKERDNVDYNDTQVSIAMDDNEDIEGEYISKNAYKILIKMVKILPPDEKKLIIDVFVKGESYQQYSDLNNISYNKVIYTKRKALKRMKEYAKKYYDVEKLEEIL